MFSRKAVFVVALLVLALAASRANAISCARAIVALGPCRDYLVNKSNMLTSLCCQAANSLNNMVKSKEDIRNLCECFKKAVVALKVNVGRAKAIPKTCKIRVPVTIDPNVNCARI